MIQGSDNDPGIHQDGIVIDLAGVRGVPNYSGNALFIADNVSPSVAAISNPASAQFALAGSTLSITLVFSEIVKLSSPGQASITATIGTTDVTLTATGTSATDAGVTSLTFSAALANGLTDLDGVTIKANSLFPG